MTGEPTSDLIDAMAFGLHKTRAGNDSPEYDMEKANDRAKAIWEYVRPVLETYGAEARSAALADVTAAVEGLPVASGIVNHDDGDYSYVIGSEKKFRESVLAAIKELEVKKNAP